MKKALLGTLLTALLAFNTACDRQAAVEQAVETKLRSEHISNVNASYRDGVVVLEGYVADETEHARAKIIAQETGGVKSVEDRLKVVYVPESEVLPGQGASPLSSGTGGGPSGSTTQPEVDTGEALKEYKQRNNSGNTQNTDPSASPTTNPAGDPGQNNQSNTQQSNPKK